MVDHKGARPGWIGYSRGRDQRGPVPSGSATPQAVTGGGGVVPSGSGAPLVSPPPEPTVGGRDRHPRDPLTYPTHHTRVA
jgi:hypothetical protein